MKKVYFLWATFDLNLRNLFTVVIVQFEHDLKLNKPVDNAMITPYEAHIHFFFPGKRCIQIFGKNLIKTKVVDMWEETSETKVNDLFLME